MRAREAGSSNSPKFSAAGAGNQMAVVFMDFLHKLIAEDEVVIVKVRSFNCCANLDAHALFAIYIYYPLVCFTAGTTTSKSII